VPAILFCLRPTLLSVLADHNKSTAPSTSRDYPHTLPRLRDHFLSPSHSNPPVEIDLDGAFSAAKTPEGSDAEPPVCQVSCLLTKQMGGQPEDQSFQTPYHCLLKHCLKAQPLRESATMFRQHILQCQLTKAALRQFFTVKPEGCPGPTTLPKIPYALPHPEQKPTPH